MHKYLKVAGIVFFSILLVASTGSAIYFYRQYKSVTVDTQKAEEIQIKTILANIGSVIELPNEKPTVVTITDREKLQNQEFFKKAENGDKIIVYQAAKRIYLYRPSTGRVVDIAPLVFDAANAEQSTETELTIPTPTQPVPSPDATPSSTPAIAPPETTSE